MSTTFPTSLQDLDATRGTTGQPLSSPNHITHHTNEDDTIEALQAKVGIDSSADSTSIDYKLKNTASSDPGHKHTLSSLSDFAVSSPTSGQFLAYNGTKWANSSPNIKFGGTGADGALSITSGTTTIDCANAALVVKNYTSISISGTGKLAFSNPNTTGTTIILKSQGAVTITSSTVPAIDIRSMGGAAGGAPGAGSNTGGGGGGGASISTDGTAGSAGSGAPNTGGVGSNGAGLFKNTGGSGGTGSGGAGGVSFATTYGISSVDFWFKTKNIVLIPGSGGGAGASGSVSVGDAGGRGAGALYIECGGAYNMTATINGAGANGATGGSGGNSGGGGGGAGGQIVIFYNTLTADSGTYTLTGGTASAGHGGGAGGNGAAGYSLVTTNVDYA